AFHVWELARDDAAAVEHQAHGLLVVLHEAREVTTAVERHGPVLRAFTHARIGPQDHVAHAAQDWFCRLAGQPFLCGWALLPPHQDRKPAGLAARRFALALRSLALVRVCAQDAERRALRRSEERRVGKEGRLRRTGDR